MEAPDYFVAGIILLLYAIWLLMHAVLLFYRRKEASKNSAPPAISVIIPFRNEGKRLIKICHQILHSHYASRYELILVDDHSENNLSAELLQHYSHHSNFKLLRLAGEKYGKKAALESGHFQAAYPWIVHLDADVNLPEDWLINFGNTLANKSPGLVAFPVFPDSSASLLNKFETLEFISIMTVTEAGFNMAYPTMANGAQLAVHKDAFTAVEGYQNDALSSGDDLFLLHKIFAKKQFSCTFEFHPKLIVTFPSSNNLKAFFHQRLRWASKSKHYQNPVLLFSALIIGLANLGFCYSFVKLCFSPDQHWLLLLIIKGMVDFVHLIPGAIRYKSLKILPFQLLLSLIYPLYASIIIFASFVYRPEWKGRKIN
jgi:biofilm PGA synthesis N-glycosyltransferase PgaC